MEMKEEKQFVDPFGFWVSDQTGHNFEDEREGVLYGTSQDVK